MNEIGEIDPDNKIFGQATDVILETRTNLFLTGKAGTGKTTFLNYIQTKLDKNFVVLAPTGIAAIRAGGQTIHSFFQLPFRPFIPDDPELKYPHILTHFAYRKAKKELLEALDIIFIDEISMVRADIMDAIDKILQFYRNNHRPFGGVQMVMIGDCFQLPPVVKAETENILKNFYVSPFFFRAKSLEKSSFLHLEFKKIYRQSDQKFIDLLNRVRENKVSNADIELLNAQRGKIRQGENQIVLMTHNHKVNTFNQQRQNELNTELFEFEALIEGDFPEKNYPLEKNLALKIGAQVMLIRNLTDKRFYNGKIGAVQSFNREEKTISVLFDDGETYDFEPQEWPNIRYHWNKTAGKIEEEVIGKFTQYPLKLAWAITVHKSQGLTFDKVSLDLGAAFAPGQVYVALSRCRSLEGLTLRERIHRKNIFSSPEVIQFAQSETPDLLVKQKLKWGKADEFYRKSWLALRKEDYSQALVYFMEAIDLRNDYELPEFKRWMKVIVYRLEKPKRKNLMLKSVIEKLLK